MPRWLQSIPPDRGFCIEPVVFRLADLRALQRESVAQLMSSSVRALAKGGCLRPIDIAVGSFPAHISRRFIRYVAFQWLNTVDGGRLNVDRLRDGSRILVAATLSDELHLQSTVEVGKPQNFAAIP